MVRPSRFNNSINTNRHSNQSRTSSNNNINRNSIGSSNSNVNETESVAVDGQNNQTVDQPNQTINNNNNNNNNDRRDRNGVSGPTSALTSFLREQGIRPRRDVNRFSRRQPDQPVSNLIQTADQNDTIQEEEEEEDNDNDDDDEVEVEVEIDSDNLDESTTNNRSSRARTASKKNKTAQKKSSSPSKDKVASTSKSDKSKKRKKKKPDDDDGDDDDSDFEPDFPKLLPKPGKYSDRKPGHITTCVECGKRFTVTRYTLNGTNNHNQPGQLCDECTEDFQSNNKNKNFERDQGPSKKRRKVLKKTNKNKGVLNSDLGRNNFQTLQMACISVIAKNIESIDALGNIGSVNLDKICQIVCKHRELKPVNLPLFLDVSHTELKLYDCIHLRKDHLISIPSYCPRLERLKLNLCGHLDGEVMINYAEKLWNLIEVELFGAYLIRRESWLEVFKIWNSTRRMKIGGKGLRKDEEEEEEEEGDDQEEGLNGGEEEEVEINQGPRILRFNLKQSPRFDLDCMRALVETCPNLVNLRLDDIGLLDDRSLELIGNLRNLRVLSISNAGILNGSTGENLTDEAVVKLLESVGECLETLDLSQNKKLTDKTLVEGIAKNCKELKNLNLSQLREINTFGMVEMFKVFDDRGCPGLESFDISRCIRVGNEGLLSMIEHSGRSLKYLNLNSVDELREEGLESLSDRCRSLLELDVSFVRDVDDFVIKSFLENMNELKVLNVFGDNRVSDQCPSKRGVQIKGQERSIII